MMGAYVVAPHIESVFRQMFAFFNQKAAATARSGASQNSSRPGLLLPSLILCGLAAAQYPRQAMLTVDKDYYPVTAMQFMADNHLEGKAFVTFNWAQYALAVFADSNPNSRIAFDGRFRTCYPQHIIDMYFDFTLGDLPDDRRYREDESGSFDPTKALSFRDPDLVLFERERRNAIETMEAASDEWCLLYQDSLAQLWGRRSVYDDPQSPDFLPQSARDIGNDLQEGAVAWPGFPVVPRPMRVAVK